MLVVISFRLTMNFVWPDSRVKRTVREYFGISDDDLARDIEIVKEWIRKQPHLPITALDDDFIEKSLLRNKFSVERTKERLEHYYTYKALHLDAFRDVEILPPKETNDIVVPLPELTDALERIVLIKINHRNDRAGADVMRFLKHAICASELYLRNDYPVGVRIVQDLGGFAFEDFAKYAPKLRTYAALYQEAYFSRVLGIEYVNASGFVDVFLQCTKALMSPKVFKRITVHKNFESLHRKVNKKYLPREYDGEGRTIPECLEIWEKEFEAHVIETQNQLATEISDESLRIGGVRTNEAFGVDGTFKSLRLD